MATVSDKVLDGDAAATAAQDLAVGAWGGGAEPGSKSDRYLAKRLAAASADYKGVAITTFLLGAAVAGFFWLAAGILAEHWLVPGGLPRAARWAWLAAGVVALVAAAIRWVVPLVRYRVNLVYAARAIEHEHPELHNDLVNTVLVKAHPEASTPFVVRSLERRTAKRLSNVPMEAVIDRTLALRLAYVLATLVALACLYEVAAPKSLFVSAARLIAPWVGWAAPSRVRIEPPRLAWRMPDEADAPPAADDAERRRIAIDAGAATLVRGRQLVVAAGIHGLRREERPAVIVTPLQGNGSVDPTATPWQVEMTRGQAGTGADKAFVTRLPDAARGLDRSVEIVIAAGDARSEPVRVAVVDSPSLLVRELRYSYPAYTRRPGETVAWQGDIRAVEGTEVTIVAESNQPLEDAWIDFDCDGSRDLKFNKSATDLTRVSRSFHLHLKADQSAPEHGSYRLFFQPRGTASAGREQVLAESMDHRIEVIADLAPEVSIEEPRESPLRVPPDAPVTVRVRAIDPDFALASVGIETRLQGGPVQSAAALLAREHAGVFKGAAQVVPEGLGARPGNVLEYRAVAVDTRPKQPNVSHSPWQSLTIDASAPPRKPEQPPQRTGGDQQNPSQQGQGKNEDKSQDKSQPDKSQNGQDKNQGQDKNAAGEDKSEQGASQQGQQGDPKQGKQSGGGEGGNQGDKQESQGQSQRGDQQGQGTNQGQGADNGQGLGAQGERMGGSQSGERQQPGAESGGAGKNGSKEGSKPGTSGGAKPGSEGRGQQQGEGQSPGGEQQGKGDQQGQSGRQREGEQQGQRSRGQGRQAPDSAVAADGTNDGEAMERILEHRRQTEGDSAGQSGSGAQSGEEQANGRPGAGAQRRDAESGQSGQAGQESKDGEQSGQEGKPGEQGSSSKQGEGTASQKKPDGQEPGGQQGRGQDQSAQGKPGPGQAAQERSGEGKSGEGKQAQPAAGGQGQEQQAPGAGKTEGRQQGAQQADGQSGDQEEAGGPSGAGDRKGSAAGQDKQGEMAEGGDGAQGQSGAAQQADGRQPSGRESGGERAGASGQTAQPGPGTRPAQPEAGKPGDSSTPTGSGGWAGGDRPDRQDRPLAEGSSQTKEMEWGEQDLANARNAANLAVEHLRKAVEAGRTDVLDQLGWTRDQARAFLERWEKMQHFAESGDPARRGEFDRAVRSLGLRPDGVRTARDVPADVKGGQAEGRRSRPPSDYREQFKAYTQGTAGE